MLLLQQQQQAAQQQLGQQVMQQQMPQQPRPVMSPHGHPAALHQSMLQHPQQMAAHQQSQPQMQQQLQQQLLQQQQQARLSSLHGISQQPFPLQPMNMQRLQQQQFMGRSPVQQQLTQQAPMQLSQPLQHQQQLHLQQQQQQHTMPSPQRHFLQQQQLHPGPQQHGHHQQQGCMPQPPQLSHQQLQQQQLQQQQLHQLHAQHALLQQQQAQHGDAAAAALSHMGTPKGASSGSSSAPAGSGLLAVPSLGARSYSGRLPPHELPKGGGPSSTIILAAAPMEAVQIAARPGSSSTVADLVREAMEAAEAAEATDPDTDFYGAAREADQGFSVHDLLDFTEDIAALMEAFMNPELAVAAEALELMVQLALDFIDDLVEKALEHRRQQQDGVRRPRGSRRRQPQLFAEDLLAGLSTHPRKALRCKEALENYRMLEEFKLAFPEDRYLSAPAQGQSQPPVSPQSTTTPTGPQQSGPNAPSGQTPLQDPPSAPPPQGPNTPLDNVAGRQRAATAPSTHVGDPHGLTSSPTLRTQQHDPTAFANRPRSTPSAPGVLPLNP